MLSDLSRTNRPIYGHVNYLRGRKWKPEGGIGIANLRRRVISCLGIYFRESRDVIFTLSRTNRLLPVHL